MRLSEGMGSIRYAKISKSGETNYILGELIDLPEDHFGFAVVSLSDGVATLPIDFLEVLTSTNDNETWKSLFEIFKERGFKSSEVLRRLSNECS